MQTLKSHFAFFWSVMFFLAVFGDLGDAEVVVLNDEDFEQTIQERDLALVNFYASKNCDECSALAPHYTEAALALKNSKANVMLADIDCIAGGEAICKAYGIENYPVIIGFKRGEAAFVYNGLETSSGIVEYIWSQPEPFIAELLTLKELNDYLQELDPSVIGFFHKLDTEKAVIFEKAAALLSDRFRFALCQSDEILKEYQYRNFSDIIIFQSSRMANDLEPSQLKYTGLLLASNLVPWIRKNIFGLAGLRTRNNVVDFQAPFIVVYFEIDFIKKAQQTKFWRNSAIARPCRYKGTSRKQRLDMTENWLDFSIDLKDSTGLANRIAGGRVIICNRVLKVAKIVSAKVPNITFALSNALDFEDELDEYKLAFDEEKPVVAGRDVYNQKFVLREDFTVERLHKFAESLAYGHLKPYLKSQDVPSANDDQVKVVVADSFDSIVNDPREDVFLELYDPQSPICQNLAPVLVDLAEQLKREYAIVIAKIDAVGNELPLKFKIEEFPTFYFARKGHKAEPMLYKGHHTVTHFIEFIAKHASYPLKTFGVNGQKLKQKKKL